MFYDLTVAKCQETCPDNQNHLLLPQTTSHVRLHITVIGCREKMFEFFNEKRTINRHGKDFYNIDDAIWLRKRIKTATIESSDRMQWCQPKAGVDAPQRNFIPHHFKIIARWFGLGVMILTDSLIHSPDASTSVWRCYVLLVQYESRASKRCWLLLYRLIAKLARIFLIL